MNKETEEFIEKTVSMIRLKATMNHIIKLTDALDLTFNARNTVITSTRQIEIKGNFWNPLDLK